MFNTIEIAKRIKQARISKNMTQLQLADAMGVSFQAVSNWERGNSMPDISKLADLCGVLGLSVNALLGIEDRTAAAVTKAMEQAELTPEELAEVAPILPPAEVKSRVESGSKGKKLRLSAIADIAPFLDEAYLDELIADVDMENLDGLVDIAPFLSEAALERLVEQTSPECFDEILEIAPFLSDKALDKLVTRCAEPVKLDKMTELAPFVSEETLDRLIDGLLSAAGDSALPDLSGLFPFLSNKTLKKVAQYLMDHRDLDGLSEIMPFV